jgi:hypothetical protein
VRDYHDALDMSHEIGLPEADTPVDPDGTEFELA